MKKQYHILNGDLLKRQFPAEIEGDIIVLHECLVDGNVQGNTLEEFYSARAVFLCSEYGVPDDYYEKVVPEFQKILDIEKNSEVNFWFEDDLFCQVNFWFAVHLANQNHGNLSFYLIRPETHTQFGFGGQSQGDLQRIFKNRIQLNNPLKIAELWEAYKTEDPEKLLELADNLTGAYPFILPAVQAHIERIPSGENPGRPTRTLIEIMREHKTQDFAVVFREFCRRESIYGLGDLQVKKLFNALLDDNQNMM